MNGHDSGQYRVSIRLRASNTACSYVPLGSADVFDDNRLPKRLSHVLRYHPCDDVENAATGARNDDSDRAVRVVLRRCESRYRQKRSGARGETNELTTL
jgi:hypothetical protein